MTAVDTSLAPVSRKSILRLVVWVVVIVAVVGGLIWLVQQLVTFAPITVNTRERLLPPLSTLRDGSLALLGTDQVGRDVFRQVLEGARTSMTIAFSAGLLATLVGIAVGVAAGWTGGRTEAFILRVVDVQLSFPSILVAIFLAAFLPASVISVICVLAVSRWAMIARLTRAITVKAKAQGYVEAALVSGYSTPKILTSCILPNLAAPLLVVVTADISGLILAEAALSFLGIGAPTNVISWGRIISDGQDYLDSAWWIATLPGVVVATVVILIGVLSEIMRRRMTSAGWTSL